MKEIIIHIGYFKTGTTALQNFCHQNDEELLKHGMLYPKAFRDLGLENHSFLAFFLCDELNINIPWWAQDWFLAIKKKHNFAKEIKKLRREIERTDCRMVLISSEEFVRLGHEKGNRGIEKLRSIFEGYEFKILCCLRRQDDYVETFYNFLVKEGVQRPYYKNDIGKFIQHYHNYPLMLSYWDKIFGVKNIIIKIYPTDHKMVSSFLPDILFRIGLDKKYVEGIQIDYVNISIDNRYIEFLRHANETYQDDPDTLKQIRNDIIALSRKNRQLDRERIGLLSPYDRSEILGKVESANLEICRRYNIRPPLFGNEVKHTSYVSIDMIAAYDLEIYNHLLERKANGGVAKQKSALNDINSVAASRKIGKRLQERIKILLKHFADRYLG